MLHRAFGLTVLSILCTLGFSQPVQAVGVQAFFPYSFDTRNLEVTARTWRTTEPQYWSMCSLWDNPTGEEEVCVQWAVMEWSVRVIANVYTPGAQAYWGQQRTDSSNAIVQNSFNFPVGLNTPPNGLWSMYSGHYLITTYWICGQYGCWQYDQIPQQVATASGNRCAGVPAHMEREYLPLSQGGVYVGVNGNGIEPHIPCQNFEHHDANFNYIGTFFTWGDMNDHWDTGNPNTNWGYIKPSVADSLALTRAYYGNPIRISSGYRSPRGNSNISGSATNSHHMRGRAIDMYKYGVQEGHCPSGPTCWTEAEFNELKAVAEYFPYDESFHYTKYPDRHYHVAWQ